MLKENLLRLALGPLILLILLLALLLGGHVMPSVQVAPAQHLLACGGGVGTPCGG